MYEYALVQSVLPGVTLDDITTMARARLAETSDVILATSPQKASVQPPSETELRAAVAAGDRWP